WTSPETPQIAKLPRRAALGFGYTEISRAAPAVPEQAAITIPVIRPWQYLGRYATPEHSPSPCTRSCAGQPWPERVASCPPGGTVSRTIDRFLLHKAPSKHRIFALVLDGGTEELEAVATLHKDDLHLSSELLGAMMTTLGTGDPTPVEETLESLPEAVAAGVRQYLPSDHAPEPGSRRYSGALNSSLNKIFVPDEPSDFDRGQISALLEAAWTIPVAVRADNMITEEGGLYWRVHFFQEVPFI